LIPINGSIYFNIYTDICRLCSTESYGRSKYLLPSSDHCSRLVSVICLKHTSDTPISHHAYVNNIDRQFDQKINRIRCDDSGEYISNELKYFGK
jgi:hypothetical protein